MSVIAAAGLSACGAPGLTDEKERGMARDVVLVSRDDGLLGEAAMRRLAKAGAQAIAPLEAALYDADPGARCRLLRTMSLADPREAAPVLRHFAAFSGDPRVAACAAVLGGSVAQPSNAVDPRTP